ncbi:MAG: hypothetical protein K8T10_21935 [Candidatus Eremiobacteraeota bacterium]|nr:hypothetical protein [Candidatus Eremiobacteraeota bacterium]
MDGRTRKKKETFVAKAFREFRENVVGGFTRANEMRLNANRFINGVASRIEEYGFELPVCIASVIVGFISAFIPIKIQGHLFHNVNVFVIIFMFIVSFIICTLIAGTIIISLAYFLFQAEARNYLFIILTTIIQFIVIIFLITIYTMMMILFVLLKFLILIPLFFLVLFTRLIHTQKKIYHTCPYCSYRGLPLYVCPDCGEFNEKLWPNLYGLLHHDCAGCGKSLPTLDVHGRNKMEQRCDHCEKPILSQNTAPVPEKLVAIVGGHRSGKTSYLIMAVDEITNGNNEDEMRIKGEIEIQSQKEKLGQELKKLSGGIPLDKDEEISEPFLLYAEVNKKKCLIYLYDTPGGKFETFSTMSEKHYFTLLEGLVLLVDPLSFKSVRAGFNGLDYQPTPLKDVVDSVLNAASSGIPLEKSGKFKMHVAVVVSKADMECVRDKIGDKLTETACRETILEWGGESAIRSIELRFENVEYFACSPLGRDGDPDNQDPFRGYGIMEPLDWVLSDRDN